MQHFGQRDTVHACTKWALRMVTLDKATILVCTLTWQTENTGTLATLLYIPHDFIVHPHLISVCRLWFVRVVGNISYSMLPIIQVGRRDTIFFLGAGSDCRVGVEEEKNLSLFVKVIVDGRWRGNEDANWDNVSSV